MISTFFYEKYLKLNIKGAYVGLEQGGDETHYFCTPEGAEIIGWAGVDGIHFCFIRGFGEMVFAVSPANTPGNYVHPLARSFEDFLRLLLACGGTAPLEQAWCWEPEQFDEFLKDNPPTVEQAATLASIREDTSLTPMEQPFFYLSTLQGGFDYRLIPYTKEYYDVVSAEPAIPEWKVCFEGSFWGHYGSETAGKEVTLNRSFFWEQEAWTIPAVYVCGKGLVVDFCMKVPPERIRAFMEKWNISAEDHRTAPTDEQRMRIDAENPLSVNIHPKVILNGAELKYSHSCGLCWNPCFPEGNGLEAWSAMRHYDLDPDQGYAIWRSDFPWKTKRKPQIKTLSVTLGQEPVAVPGPHFCVSSPGDQVDLIHPATGKKHTLTVQDYERQALSAQHFNDPHQEFPTHYVMMSYTISPDLPDRSFAITGCARGDRSRQKHADPGMPQATGDVGIAIISGMDGPAATAFGDGNGGKLRAACSALHFESIADVEWRIVFYEITRKDITVELV